jgi:cytosine/uracil/thiamine/allantoin permease
MVVSSLKKAFSIQVPERDGQTANHLINHDIVPMPPSRRTWDWLEFTGFFFISEFCIGVWAGSAAVLGIGLAVWEVMVSGLIAGLLILAVGGAVSSPHSSVLRRCL